MSTVETDSGEYMARRQQPRGPNDPTTLEFGRRLSRAIADRGWTQADFVTQANKFAPKDKKLRRDNISLYVRGIQMPAPARMVVLCKTLGMQESDLVPAKDQLMTSETPPLAMKPIDGGNVWLQINQSVPLDIAMEIIALMKRDSNGK